jgi:glyoxylase-like metal-dependent hydrolase (beta-lactamase superfamily II)
VSTTQINGRLIQITRLRFVNAFLVREDDGFTLVDTTVGGGADMLVEAARDAGGAIKRIALTHGHGDHVGSLDALKQKLGNTVEVLMPDLDARIHAGEKVLDGKKPPGSWPKITTKPNVRLTGGERIASLEVIPTPGHTPGHVSFLDTRDHTVIVGDTLTAIGALAVSSHFYWRFPLAAPATWDKVKNVESARRIRALDPAMLVFGHGGPVRSPAAALDKAIARAGG